MAAVRRWIHTLLLRIFGLLPLPIRRGVVRATAPKYTVGAVCLIHNDRGELLLIHQSYGQLWGLPGGLAKPLEHPRAAVKREIREELGVRIELIGEPGVHVDPEGERVDVVFWARLGDGVTPEMVKPVSPEIASARWYRAEALPALQHEAILSIRALERMGHLDEWKLPASVSGR